MSQKSKVEERFAKYDSAVYPTLVDALYTPIPSLILGASVLTFMAVVTSIAAWSWPLMALSVLVAMTTIHRVFVVAAYGRYVRKENIVASTSWERRYALAAYLVSASVGLFDLLAISITNSGSIDVLVTAVTVGFVSSLSGRTAARPDVVVPQIALIIAPLAIGLLMRREVLTDILAALLFLNMLSTKGLVKSLNKTLFQAIDATHENSLLAQRLKERNSLFDEALVHTGHGLCVLDSDGCCLVSNDLFLKLLTGRAIQAEPNRPLLSLLERAANNGTIDRPNLVAIAAALDSTRSSGAAGLVSLTTRSGRTIELEFRKTSLGHVAAVAEDVTERRLADAKIEKLAHFDQLTGLRNRTTFHADLDRTLAMLPISGQSAALMSLDLDHFKQVNDAMGHPVGDALLRAVADRLRASVRDTDSVARFGGDEFLVLQYPIISRDEAASLASRIVSSLSEPYFIDGQQIVIGASLGVAMAPENGGTSIELIQHSDLALYKAKNMGRGVHAFFDESMNSDAKTRRGIESEIRRAVEQHEFELHFQPIVKLDGGGIISCEALLRWNHPLRGMVGPAEFLAIAEETGAITAIGDWVLEEACRHAVTWPEDISVAVNLSPVQFRFKDLVGSVRRALEKSGLSPRRLELEITESVLMEDVLDNRGTIEELVGLGISVSLDDFGTGHSSLSHLHSLNLTRVKLDKSFVQDVGSNPVSSAVVQSVTNIARAKGIQVVAEGIEDRDQADIVTALGCTLGQGYLYGRPVSHEEITRVIAVRPNKAAA